MDSTIYCFSDDFPSANLKHLTKDIPICSSKDVANRFADIPQEEREKLFSGFNNEWKELGTVYIVHPGKEPVDSSMMDWSRGNCVHLICRRAVQLVHFWDQPSTENRWRRRGRSHFKNYVVMKRKCRLSIGITRNRGWARATGNVISLTFIKLIVLESLWTILNVDPNVQVNRVL